MFYEAVEQKVQVENWENRSMSIDSATWMPATIKVWMTEREILDWINQVWALRDEEGMDRCEGQIQATSNKHGEVTATNLGSIG